MFNQNITYPIPPLTSTYINKLTRIQSDPDFSLISLATAVIKPRVENYDGIEGLYYYLSVSSQLANKVATLYAARKDMNGEYKKNVPGFFYLLANCSEDDLNDLQNKSKEIGLTELTAVESFVKQQLVISNYRAFISEEHNAAFVIVNSTSMALYHLSISFISLLYPALFKKVPLTKEEMEVLKGLTNKTSTNFVERTTLLLDYMKMDLLREELASCFKGFRQNRIDQCKRELDDADARADNALQEYYRRVEAYNEIMIRYEGLQIVNGDSQNEEEKEVIEYLSTCKKIHNVNYTNGTLSFLTDTLLTNFDMNKWRNAVRRSNIYDNYRLAPDNVFRDKIKRKLLFDNIFSVKPLLYVKVKGHIQLNITRGGMEAPRGQIDADACTALRNCLSNPHFKIHGCPGRNREQIIRCIRQGDVVSAIECSIAATGSVNIDETEYTFRPFLQEILTSGNKILENNAGETMTPEEAVLWLSKQDLNPEDDETPTVPF